MDAVQVIEICEEVLNEYHVKPHTRTVKGKTYEVKGHKRSEGNIDPVKTLKKPASKLTKYEQTHLLGIPKKPTEAQLKALGDSEISKLQENPDYGRKFASNPEQWLAEQPSLMRKHLATYAQKYLLKK